MEAVPVALAEAAPVALIPVLTKTTTKVIIFTINRSIANKNIVLFLSTINSLIESNNL